MSTPPEETLERIQAGPRWRFVLRPEPYEEERLALDELLATIGKATVRLRGWDFPHMNRHIQPLVGTNWVGSRDDFRGHLEHWRLYESGQFIYLSGVREWSEPDWARRLADISSQHIMTAPEGFDWSSVPGYIELRNFIYTITEFFEFSARLAQGLPRAEAVELTIGLHDISGFVLTVDDFQRAWWEYYAAQEPHLERSWRLPLVDLVGSSGDHALSAIRWFVMRFGWLEPNIEAIKQDQERLLSGLP